MNYINGKWRQRLHLEPPHGWMNDPNGLCFFGGKYHFYFQYAPDSADGEGRKCWGHYESPNLTEWTFTGTVLFPDTPDDKDGAFSGSALASVNGITLFYTGNVFQDGKHDYTTSGREANVISVTTSDGHNMSVKQTLLRNSDYPDFCSCHVRDPKVWCENDGYRMVLGARTLADEGCVLYFSSDNSAEWHYDGFETLNGFGYMWECPDRFSLCGHTFLSISPQGLPHGEFDYQNIYSSGFFKSEDGLSDFTEWDYGFDFYAPQSFEAPDGRCILVGWMGIGDIPYVNPTVPLGYQHCLTIPRELSISEDGTLLQNPIKELETLIASDSEFSGNCETSLPFMLKAKTSESFKLTLDRFAEMKYENCIFTLEFTDMTVSGGRTLRKARLSSCKDITIIADMSSLEIFLDGGKRVVSSRYYPENVKHTIHANGVTGKLYTLNGMKFDFQGE